jgi:hypothetical protein
VCPECRTAASEPPMLEEAVHVDVGQQRARHPSNNLANSGLPRSRAVGIPVEERRGRRC